MAYIGTSPSNGVRRVHTYTATASQTTFTGASSEGVTLSYADTNYLDVYQNGILLGSADYTATSGTSVVLAQAASASDLVVIVVYDVFSVADTVSKTNGGSFDSAVTMSDNLTVSGAFTSQGIDDNATSTAMTIDSSQGVTLSSNGDATQLKIKRASASQDNGLSLVDQVGTAQAYFNLEGTATNNLQIASTAEIQFFSSSTLGNPPTNERARINSAGNLLVGNHVTSSTGIFAAVNGSGTTAGFIGYDSTSPFATTHNGLCAIFNRHTSDGIMIELKQDNVIEGTISVSGTTVSYNGGHLSRFSQLADNTRDNTIVKGTVMTNLDQMAEWITDGVTEDNEQLNCMAVSSVEGDVNVAGVFVNWDDDDDLNDMNVAMTGDMVIRIAQGTTVSRGDLLMSAGDGTAKPQGDDIVRSKTIAKVTSTNVSHTYDDGSYLVPCVLMAC